MRTLLVGSGNRKKLAELVSLLGDLPVRCVAPHALSPAPETPLEDGDTLRDNAAIKALGYARQTGLWTLADDSGLMVDALDGRPGVHSARYGGAHGDDAANNRLLLRELDGRPEEERTARFECCIALATPHAVLASFEGTVDGRILTAPAGDGGFGYDPLFFCPELGKSFAEASAEEKARVSHRARALTRLRDALPDLLSPSGE